MKGFMAVWGDGRQARCSFVFYEKNCSHHFPLSLAPTGRRSKAKSHLLFQTELDTAQNSQDRGEFRQFIFIMLGMFKTWE